MTNRRYTPEFKEEAVRQVIETNHSKPIVDLIRFHGLSRLNLSPTDYTTN